jgi:hypothetical protein
MTNLTAILGAVAPTLATAMNRTREEMAKEYVTKSELHTDINRVLTRLEALDTKIDRLMERVTKA